MQVEHITDSQIERVRGRMLSTTPTGGGDAKKLYKINFDYTHSTIFSPSPKNQTRQANNKKKIFSAPDFSLLCNGVCVALYTIRIRNAMSLNISTLCINK